MFTRCQRLGERWEFLYHVVYRDLSDTVHSSFVKTPHSPSLAASSPNQGDALIYEHCRTVSYAIDFWAFGIVEYCRPHPKPAAVSALNAMLASLRKHEARLFGGFPRTSKSHAFLF